jgi:CRP/FNR family transcriptional regulator, cyclic AMP receptor protein
VTATLPTASSRAAARTRTAGAVRVPEHLEGALAGLTRAEAERALARCRAPVLVLPRGRWRAPDDPVACAGWTGVLVVDGLLTRTIEVEGLRAQELLGPGDLIRPWDDDGEARPLPIASSWRALDRTSVALLDARFAAVAAGWPSITNALVAAGVRRSHWLVALLGISRARRADTRLLLLFWHLAERWGRVGPDGVVVPLRLAHSRLGELVCLRRPTVTAALTALRERGRVLRRDDGTWLLRDAPAAAEGRAA